MESYPSVTLKPYPRHKLPVAPVSPHWGYAEKHSPTVGHNQVRVAFYLVNPELTSTLNQRFSQ